MENMQLDLPDGEEYEVEIPDVIRKFASEVLDREHEVIKFDYRHIDIDACGNEFTIRTWNITETHIRWTLYKMISHGDGTGHGEEIKSGLTDITRWLPKNQRQDAYRTFVKFEEGLTEIGTYFAQNDDDAIFQAASESGEELANILVYKITDPTELIDVLYERISELSPVGYTDDILGTVFVESGQLMIVDPCYLEKWKAGDFIPDEPDANNYSEACNASLSSKGYGSILGGSSIAFSSGFGDGEYPVYGKRDEDGRIVKIEIDMNLY